jgi:hypothetical protein
MSPSSWTFIGSGTSNEQSGSATLPLWCGRAALGSSTAPLKQKQTFFTGSTNGCDFFVLLATVSSSVSDLNADPDPAIDHKANPNLAPDSGSKEVKIFHFSFSFFTISIF